MVHQRSNKVSEEVSKLIEEVLKEIDEEVKAKGIRTNATISQLKGVYSEV